MTFRLLPLLIATLGLSACQEQEPKISDTISEKLSEVEPAQTKETTPANKDKDTVLVKSVQSNPQEILARKEVPILCYHQIRAYKPTDSKIAKDYIVPPELFANQMQTLKDSGFNTILPDDLYNYLNFGKQLPEKPILLSFDDTDLEQYTVAKPEMEKRGFKGVFFIMTVSIGRPHYMTKEQIKDLADKGHVIGSHTWDHHNVKKYQGDDWKIQIEKPTRQLEEITGKKIQYFAYPFGLWNKEAIPELKSRGFKAAFQLYAKQDEQDPLFTIRRIIITGDSKGAGLIKRMKSAYHL